MGQKILELLFAWAYRLLFWTYRFENINLHHISAAQKVHPTGAYLLAFWHEDLLAATMAQYRRPMNVMVSKSKHGRILASGLSTVGLHPIFGSAARDGQDKGGLEARRLVLEGFKQGQSMTTAVDGSVGPAYEAKAGMVELSRTAQVAVVAVAASSKSFWRLKTWDRTFIPKPFSKVRVVYGEPIVVPKTAKRRDFPEFQKLLGDRINHASSLSRSSYLRNVDGVMTERT